MTTPSRGHLGQAGERPRPSGAGAAPGGPSVGASSSAEVSSALRLSMGALAASSAAGEHASDGRPEIRYAQTADGVHIAYQVAGDGPVDLVVVASGLGLGEIWRRDDRRCSRRLAVVQPADPPRPARHRVVRSHHRAGTAALTRDRDGGRAGGDGCCWIRRAVLLGLEGGASPVAAMFAATSRSGPPASSHTRRKRASCGLPTTRSGCRRPQQPPTRGDRTSLGDPESSRGSGLSNIYPAPRTTIVKSRTSQRGCGRSADPATSQMGEGGS